MRTVIYDFDGTLFNSPTREEAKAALNTDFPFQGWWGRLESLTPPVVPQKPTSDWYIEKTVEQYRKDAQDPNTKLVLMTGRPVKVRTRVQEICDLYHLKFHEYYFRGQKNQKGNDTFEIKCNLITESVIHQELKILEIHEDREEHIAGFMKFASIWKKNHVNLGKILIHDVIKSESHEIN